MEILILVRLFSHANVAFLVLFISVFQWVEYKLFTRLQYSNLAYFSRRQSLSFWTIDSFWLKSSFVQVISKFLFGSFRSYRRLKLFESLSEHQFKMICCGLPTFCPKYSFYLYLFWLSILFFSSYNFFTLYYRLKLVGVAAFESLMVLIVYGSSLVECFSR